MLKFPMVCTQTLLKRVRQRKTGHGWLKKGNPTNVGGLQSNTGITRPLSALGLKGAEECLSIVRQPQT